MADDILPESGCNVVHGSGNPDPLVMVIAEAPGEDEDRMGLPLVGKSGTLLRGEMSLAGIDPYAVWFTNAVKCHPHKNRTPKDAEIEAWLPAFRREFYLRTPVHVILAGRVAEKLWSMFNWQDYAPDVTVHYIMHPSAVLRDRKKMPAWREALHRIGAIVNGADLPPVVQIEPDPWYEDEPDWNSAWLSADTEYKLLTDGGDDDGLVSVQVSDGVSAKFARFRDIDDVRGRLRESHVFAHNIKADATHLGVDLDNLATWDDTGLIAYVLRYPRVGLKTIGPEITGIPMEPITSILTGYTTTEKVVRLTKRGLPQGTRNVSIEDQGDGTYLRITRKQKKINFEEALEEKYEEAKEYALKDAVVTARVAQELVPRIQSEPVLWRYYTELEKPIVPILDRMERRGILIDESALEPLSVTLTDAVQFHDNELRAILDMDDSFNPRSAEKLAAALVAMGLPLVSETKGGALSVSEDALLRAVGEIDLEKMDESTDDEKRLAVLHVLRSREYAKLRTTYVDRLLRDRDSEGRIHASFNQMVAATNRFSSSGPNLQNIPVRGNVGSSIRRAFVSAPGYTLVKTDFSALEVRVFAHLTQDAAMISAFEQGISPHDLNAQRFGVDRGKIKNWYFAVIYGAEALRAALTAGVTIEEAWAMMRKVMDESPAIVEWPVIIQNQLIEKGYTETVFGWREYYPHFMSTIKAESAAALREAANLPVQGSASGIVKKFMIEQDKVAREMGGGIELQVHDETVAEIPTQMVRPFANRTVAIVRALGGMGVGFSVPLDVEVKAGRTWADMKTLYKEGVWKS